MDLDHCHYTGKKMYYKKEAETEVNFVGKNKEYSGQLGRYRRNNKFRREKRLYYCEYCSMHHLTSKD